MRVDGEEAKLKIEKDWAIACEVSDFSFKGVGIDNLWKYKLL